MRNRKHGTPVILSEAKDLSGSFHFGSREILRFAQDDTLDSFLLLLGTYDLLLVQ